MEHQTSRLGEGFGRGQRLCCRMFTTMTDLDRLLAAAPPADPALVCAALVDEYAAYLLRLATSILHDPVEAEDVVQEALLRALAHRADYQPGGNLRGWLGTITVNLCRDALRRDRARRAGPAFLAAAARLVRRSPDPEEETIAAESRDRLWAAVDRLDEKHRLPVILRFAHGLPISEIATILGVAEGTIHSRLHYSLRRLQRDLGDWDGFEPSVAERAAP
jgi:RNA polymerase sigma-70 factor (ECF subfamily)